MAGSGYQFMRAVLRRYAGWHWSVLKMALLSLFLSTLLLVAPPARSQDASLSRQLTQPPAVDSSQTPQRGIALVIGNSNYLNVPRLNNPVNDAKDLAISLRKLRFEVLEGENQTNEQMKRLILTFGEKLKKGGVGLFYYAGHGIQVNGRNYLIPVEADILREQTVEFDAVDVGRVLAEMDAARNGFNIVILDACRSNPFMRGWRSADNGLAQINAPEGTLIAYATGPGKVARDGVGRNGVYTSELLKQIDVPGLTVEAMFKLVRARVKALTGSQQVPWESSSLVGDFYFAGNSTKLVKTVPAQNNPPAPLDTAQKLEVNEDILSHTVKTKGLTFVLRQCELSGTIVNCYLQLRNDGGNRDFMIELGNENKGYPLTETHMVDKLGNKIYAQAAIFDGNSRNLGSRLVFNLRANSVENITLRFINAPPAITHINSLAIGWLLQYGPSAPFGVSSQPAITFRNIPVVSSNRIKSSAEPLRAIMWLEHNVSIGGLPVFLEFESGGNVRTRTPKDKTGYVAGNITWFRSEDTIYVLHFEGLDKKILLIEYKGVIKGSRIEGTRRNLKTGLTSPWLLTRLDD